MLSVRLFKTQVTEFLSNGEVKHVLDGVNNQGLVTATNVGSAETVYFACFTKSVGD